MQAKCASTHMGGRRRRGAVQFWQCRPPVAAFCEDFLTVRSRFLGAGTSTAKDKESGSNSGKRPLDI